MPVHATRSGRALAYGGCGFRALGAAFNGPNVFVVRESVAGAVARVIKNDQDKLAVDLEASADLLDVQDPGLRGPQESDVFDRLDVDTFRDEITRAENLHAAIRQASHRGIADIFVGGAIHRDSAVISGDKGRCHNAEVLEACAKRQRGAAGSMSGAVLDGIAHDPVAGHPVCQSTALVVIP